MRKILITSGLILIWFSNAFAQEKITGLKNNRNLKATLPEQRLVKPSPLAVQAAGDTLTLPFIEDFSSSHIYPDTLLWQNRAVYINNTFPINPPSYNVATFDALDYKGDAYSFAPGDPYGVADTLTSKPINLSTQLPSDSVYLSFFYQPQGIGLDSLSGRDSLVLEFWMKEGRWARVWRTPGFPRSAFKQVMIPVTDTSCFHPAFRFRFMNYAGLTGNLNHWHVDYIRMEQNRTEADTILRDIAINWNPKPLLRNYYSLPWKQFRNVPTPANEWLDTLQLRVRNLDSNTVQVVHEYYATDKNGVFIAQDSNRLNLNKLDTVLYRFKPIPMPSPTIPEDSFVRINVQYSVVATGDKLRRNDTLVQVQNFSNYIAYDDGSAESGYSLDGPGKVAVKFKLFKPDTLRAISAYFNQAEFDTRFKAFNLVLWSAIGTKEKIVYSQPIIDAPHTDVATGLATIVLDTPQYINPLNFVNGVFYIGWQQATALAVDIGFDMNYERLLGSATTNPNLFFSTLGIWQPSIQRGAPMIRPVLGSRSDDPLTVKPVHGRNNLPGKAPLSVLLYPNPTKGNIQIETAEDGKFEYEIYDLSGRMMLSQSDSGITQMDVSGWKAGVYVVKVKRVEDLSYTFVKFVKQ